MTTLQNFTMNYLNVKVEGEENVMSINSGGGGISVLLSDILVHIV